MPGEEVRSVSWINHVPLNRREKIARWWQEDIRQGSTYSSERQRSEEFTTSIPIESIEGLACDGLKKALQEQRHERETSTSMITFPRATPDGSQYFGSIAVPAKPLGVRFTEIGVVPVEDENH